MRLVNAAMPWLEKSKAASITLISSVSGREIDFTGPAYGAFKAALVHYAQGLAFKLAGKGIRANTVSPGNTYFDGGIWQWIEKNNPALFARGDGLNPTGRMAKPEEIARGVVFLASPGFQLHDRHEPRDRRRADEGRSALAEGTGLAGAGSRFGRAGASALEDFAARVTTVTVLRRCNRRPRRRSPWSLRRCCAGPWPRVSVKRS